MDIASIAASWDREKDNYEDLGKLVAPFIRKHITECEILPEVTYRTKDIISIVKKIKKKIRSNPEYSYENLNDKLGVRIICAFTDEMPRIEKFIEKYFVVRKVERKHENLDYDKLDYISNHYDVSINSNINVFSKRRDLKDLVFEIQVRTLNQHAWSNAAHAISYKQEAEISSKLKRRVYRLLSLYEIADDEFSSVNQVLLDNPDNRLYKLLRQLESKVYKYAQVDYDRESSLYFIKTFLQFLTEDEIQLVLADINVFIDKNDAKIQAIYNSNRERYFEIPLLTQPEIFLIWFCLDKFPFSVEDNWNTEFDPYELEQIEILWGRIIA